MSIVGGVIENALVEQSARRCEIPRSRKPENYTDSMQRGTRARKQSWDSEFLHSLSIISMKDVI